MDSSEPKQVQAPLKAQYRDDPDAAVITLKAQGAIGGALAEVLFSIPPEIEAEANKRLDEHILGVIERCRNR